MQSLDKKVHLSGPRHAVHPRAAAVAVYVTPWGVQITTTLRFTRLPYVGPWVLRVPVNPNVTVLDVAAVHAAKLTDTQVRPRNGFELAAEVTAEDAARGLTIMLVTAQPVSFRRVFMEWLHFGTPATPCEVAIAVDLAELPASMRAGVDVVVTRAHETQMRTAPSSYRNYLLTAKTPITLAHATNAKLSVRLSPHGPGFGAAPRPVYAECDAGTVSLHADSRLRGTAWYVKSRPGDRDGVVCALVTQRPPAGAVPAADPDLLLAVASVVLEKNGRKARGVAPALCPTNVSALADAVDQNPMCWFAESGLPFLAHPDVEHLQRLALVSRQLPVPGDPAAYGPLARFDVDPEAEPAEDEALPDVVGMVLDALGI